MRIWRRKACSSKERRRSKPRFWTHIKHGIEIARENARLDVGQGVVVSQRNSVLSFPNGIEAFEGTMVIGHAFKWSW